MVAMLVPRMGRAGYENIMLLFIHGFVALMSKTLAPYSQHFFFFLNYELDQ